MHLAASDRDSMCTELQNNCHPLPPSSNHLYRGGEGRGGEGRGGMNVSVVNVICFPSPLSAAVLLDEWVKCFVNVL